MTTTDPSPQNNEIQDNGYPELPITGGVRLEHSKPYQIKAERTERAVPLMLMQIAGGGQTPAANVVLFDLRGVEGQGGFKLVNTSSTETLAMDLGIGAQAERTLGRYPGRGAEDLGLMDPTISRNHLELSVVEDENGVASVRVKDPGSTNGTFVSGDPEMVYAAVQYANSPYAKEIMAVDQTQADVAVDSPESLPSLEVEQVQEEAPEPQPLPDLSWPAQPAEPQLESLPSLEVPEKPRVSVEQEWVKAAEGNIGLILNGPGNTSIARDFLRTLGATPEEIRAKLDPNTGDQKARDGLELIIRRVIDNLGDQQLLPERVQENFIDAYGQGGKADNFGFSADLKTKYEPRDYSAKMALAMLDGRFDVERSKRSEAAVGMGHHREAARMALKRIGVDEKYANAPEDANKEATTEHESLHELHRALTKYINDNGMVEGVKSIIPVADDLKAITSPDMIDGDALRSRALFFVNKLEQLNARLHELRTVANGVQQKRDLGQSSKSEQRAFEDVERELQTLASRSDSISYQDYLIGKLSGLKHTDDAMHVLQIKGMIRRGQLDEIIGAVRYIGNKLQALATKGQ